MISGLLAQGNDGVAPDFVLQKQQSFAFMRLQMQLKEPLWCRKMKDPCCKSPQTCLHIPPSTYKIWP